MQCFVQFLRGKLGLTLRHFPIVLHAVSADSIRVCRDLLAFPEKSEPIHFNQLFSPARLTSTPVMPRSTTQHASLLTKCYFPSVEQAKSTISTTPTPAISFAAALCGAWSSRTLRLRCIDSLPSFLPFFPTNLLPLFRYLQPPPLLPHHRACVPRGDSLRASFHSTRINDCGCRAEPEERGLPSMGASASFSSLRPVGL